MSWIKGYKLQFTKPVTQKQNPRSPKYSSTEKHHFNEAIHNLINMGAVSKCVPCKDQFISTIFLRPKPNGKMRFILNLKNLNRFISTDHFKLEDLRTAIKLVSRDCRMATLDLKDAYHLIKIHEDSRKYLRFMWENDIYEFNVLPFGLNVAPYIFTKIMKPVVKLLRTCGFLSTIYLDDLLLIGRSHNDCIENVNFSIKLIKSLGFIVNEEKSALIPSTTCKFLGFIIDSQKLQILLPKEKRINIYLQLQTMMNLKRCKIRKFAQLVGTLISACPAIEYGMLYTKELERTKFLNLKNDNDYDKYMTLPDTLSSDFKWWLQAIKKSVQNIRTDDYHIEIYTDASTTGWGAACGDRTASGIWSCEERNMHINALELLAAFFGLKIFAKHLTSCQILLRIDNSTAIAYINRMGGIQFPHLTKISKDIWQWCEARKIYLFASYIKSADNEIADFESRRVHPDIEWELSDGAFQLIVDKFGKPEVDLFASRINAKCKKFISWHKDPDAFAVNAFTVSWSNIYFYAFPPFAIILKTLRKIVSDRANGIMIVPSWQTQPWYPLFTRLLISEIIILKPNQNFIISHSSNQNIQANLTLIAGVLCGQHYCDGACHQHQ